MDGQSAIFLNPVRKCQSGPRQGFVENRRVNTSMLRRLIASPLLWLEELQVGAVTDADNHRL